ncbi:MAG: ribbon-helix-helix domain-containing protein [Firmicutes bacterium]|nr:ribbon-helix-helix domain-containing protein [Bacillota bacterium]
MEKTKLTPIRFPTDLLNELDKYVAEGNRSKFVIEATRKELHRAKQRKAVQEVAGVFNQKDYPELNTAEDTANWVRNLREESEAIRRELFE